MKTFLVLDIETNSQDTNKAQLKWFGGYSADDDKYYLFDYTQKEEIKKLIKEHKYICGFNIKNFDNPIIENFLGEDCFEYKIILDLWECLAPKGRDGFGKYNKNRLASMGYTNLKNYKLKTIIQELKLDNENKGEIDYDIFKKDTWNKIEQDEIKKYLKQDIVITKKLLEWYFNQFQSLGQLMKKDDARKLKHLKNSIPSVAYAVVCNKAGLPNDFEEQRPDKLKSYPGGHHINPRWNLVKGNIIEIDFTSAYPHALMMCNLFSPCKDGWSGNGFYSVEGTYNNKEQGKVEKAINEILLERLKAKKDNNKPKNLSYKLVINSIYGLTGNWKFKSLYNPTTASDCTHIVRTWMKKLAKHLEENGFQCLYGFTDSIFVKIPDNLNKEVLMFLVDNVLQEFKQNVPFPKDTFNVSIEEEIKMIWFVAKNCYLFVTKDNEIKYKSTLLNGNTPAIIMKVFEEYIKPKIIKELDINFTETELKEEIIKHLKQDISLAGEEYNVGELAGYKVKTSLHYQISNQYGSGKHFLIPNTKGIGVGVGKKYCKAEEFEKNIGFEDVDISQLIKHLKPFYQTKPKEHPKC
jgi:DNA polymerase elongation subunit (family B)